MKKIFILSMLICLAMICSCRKQDSVAQQQSRQPNAEMDAREKALDERLNALDQRVNGLDQRLRALAEKEKATASTQTAPDTQTQDVMREAAQLKALMLDPSQLNAANGEKDRRAQEQLTQQQRGPEQLRSKRRKSEIAGGAVFPAPEATSPGPSPAVDAALPTPSPTPQ